eukprot:SAG31_NODE_793_length_12044_cov_12.886229_18_plen_106_part_00
MASAWVPPGRAAAAAAASVQRSAAGSSGVVKLYRHVLRTIRMELPPESRQYYRDYARENFKCFADEEDPDRVRDLVARGYESTSFIAHKYTQGDMAGAATRPPWL